MMQLVLTVMAIGLAALLVAGGINYFSTDIGVRVEVAQALRAQHDALSAAVSNYRSANNGFVHADVARLKPYLPGNEVPRFPRSQHPLSWTVVKEGNAYSGLCLTKQGELSRAGSEGLASFAGDLQRKRPGSVTYGDGCGSATVPVDLATQPLDPARPLLSVLIKGD